MKKENFSLINIFMRITLFLDIMVLAVGTFFIVTNNQTIIPYIPDIQYKNFMNEFNFMIIIIGIALGLLNLVLFFLLSFYSRQKYFKLLEKIDFENIEETVGILKKMRDIDEFGYMGRKLKEIFGIYARFSNVKKLKLNFEQEKFKVALNMIDQGILLLEKKNLNSNFKIKYINSKALNLLKLDKRSVILGKDIESLLDNEGIRFFQEYINNFEYEKTSDIFDFSIDLDFTEIKMKFLVNLSEITEQTSELKPGFLNKEPEFNLFLARILPFIFKWPYELSSGQKEKMETMKNTITDSIMIIFDKRKIK
ncbi:MAG TPA: hypothetical protein DHW82_14080 [Spirochaetia bacterium]|nr:MAG: hypothetical protein A2Y41_12035 [Spirochaetes bacterium GWB1_36_13]HCL58118.1 hypothetical protein [Spirochaetia bacterium]